MLQGGLDLWGTSRKLVPECPSVPGGLVSCRIQNFWLVALRQQDFGQWLLLEVVAFVLKPSLGPCCGPLGNLSMLLGAFLPHTTRGVSSFEAPKDPTLPPELFLLLDFVLH